MYRFLVEKGLLKLGENDLIIPIATFIDDAPIFKRSKKGKLNGIFSAILNLPPKERIKKENLLFFEFHQVNNFIESHRKDGPLKTRLFISVKTQNHKHLATDAILYGPARNRNAYFLESFLGKFHNIFCFSFLN